MCKKSVLTFPVAVVMAVLLTVAGSNRSLASSEPTAAARFCIDEGADGNLDDFAKCWVVNMMSDDQRRVAQCIAVNRGLGGAAFCMSGMQLSPFGLQVATCAQRHRGDARAITGCVGLPDAAAGGPAAGGLRRRQSAELLGGSALRRRARAHARAGGVRQLRRGDRPAGARPGRLHRRPDRDGGAAEVPERHGRARPVLRRRRRRHRSLPARPGGAWARSPLPTSRRRSLAVQARPSIVPADWRRGRIRPSTIRASSAAAPMQSPAIPMRSRATECRCLPRGSQPASSA